MKRKVKQALVTKIAIICAPLLVILIPVLLIIALTMNNPSVTCQTDTTTTPTASSDGGSNNGSLTDKNSDVGKRISYISDRFKQAGYSGDNVAAIIAIGWRESNLNPKAVNPAGSVKGIWQWGAGGINGNRYQNTADTVEAQVDLAFKELASSHRSAMLGLAAAKDIDSSALAWDTGFEGVGASDPQRKVSEVKSWAETVKKTYDLNFEGSISKGNNSVTDSNASANNSSDSDSNNQSAYCNADDGSVDGTGKIKENGLTFWTKDSVPDDVKPYLHNITSKKLDWSFTTSDAYNQCAGFSQTYMNAIWSPNFTFRGNGNVTAEAVAKATGVKVTTTPKAGAVFASDRPNHTGVVLHVLANGDLIVANQNAVKSGQNAGTSQDYEITLVPKKDYAKDSQAVGYGDMTFAYPGDNSTYKLHW